MAMELLNITKKPKVITLVAAMARDSQVIGVDNQLPWHLPVDLQHFKKVTLNKPILMGRKTFESIGRPLPNRENIVLTRDRTWSCSGVSVFYDWKTALQQYADREELMVIGGATIYQQALPIANRMLLTWVDWDGEGDAVFPAFDRDRWRLKTSRCVTPDSNNQYACEFAELSVVHSS
jgi:dihydrofolate reductase